MFTLKALPPCNGYHPLHNQYDKCLFMHYLFILSRVNKEVNQNLVKSCLGLERVTMGNVVVVDQFRGKSQQRPPFNTLPTHAIVNILEAKIGQNLESIQNLKKSRMPGDQGRAYLCQLMKDAENFLHIFNTEMVGRQDFDMNQHLKDEIHRLKENNVKLKDDYRKLEQLLKENTKDRSFKEKRADREASSRQYPGKSKSSKDGTELEIRLEKCLEQIEELQVQNASSQSLIDHLKEQKDKLENDNASLLSDKEALALRLSKMAGQRLVDNNPAIADLSDPNRPTKLGEVYSEIYDNEWTDAFEALEKAGYGEEEAIVTLRLTLVNVLEFCKNKSDALLKKTEDAVNFLFEEFQEFEGQRTPKHLNIKRSLSEQWLKMSRDTSFDGAPDDSIDLQELWRPKFGQSEGSKDHKSSFKVKKPEVDRQLKVFRKEVAESMVPIVQKAYISASWQDKECIPELYPFIKKCIFLGWMMMVQSPPMALGTCEKGEKFDKNQFIEYTASGPRVLYMVWPALKLEENGAVIGKGVAQGQKDK